MAYAYNTTNLLGTGRRLAALIASDGFRQFDPADPGRGGFQVVEQGGISGIRWLILWHDWEGTPADMRERLAQTQRVSIACFLDEHGEFAHDSWALLEGNTLYVYKDE